MAQLPPPADMSHNWSSPPFPHHRLPLPPPQSQQPSWVDEFLEFSSLRRSAHRRSASDSIAFLEAGGPLDMSRDRDNGDGDGGGDGEFDRLDDEQLMSMFTNDFSSAAPPTLLASSPSTPSDQNSNNEEKPAAPPQHVPKSELVEVESEGPQPDKSSPPANSDLIVDPKRVKRILANRQSAQRSRVRKLQYISELERSVTTLQTEVSALSPRVAFLDHQRLILNVDNSALKQRIAALAQDKIFKDAHQEALKKEIERLRQVYNHQQSMEKMRTAANDNGKQQQSEDTNKDKNSFSNSNDKNPEMKN